MAGGKRNVKKAPPMKRSRPATFAKRRNATVAKTRKMIDQALNRNIETKNSLYSSSDGVEILHNNFVTMTNALLFTSQGTADPTNGQVQNRIGDKITLRGVSLKMMYELNERYSDVTFRTIVVKSARGDVPTRITLFNNLSGNKMLDTLNRERYTILADKWTQMKAPGLQVTTAGPVGEGTFINTSSTSRATKIVKIWLPGTKFARGGVITYDGGGGQQKFFDYHVLVYAYSNYSTLADLYNVGRVNDFISQMFYKDA